MPLDVRGADPTHLLILATGDRAPGDRVRRSRACAMNRAGVERGAGLRSSGNSLTGRHIQGVRTMVATTATEHIHDEVQGADPPAWHRPGHRPPLHPAADRRGDRALRRAGPGLVAAATAGPRRRRPACLRLAGRIRPAATLSGRPAVEEIWINQPGRVFIARHGRSELTTVVLSSEDVRDLVERMLKPSGRRLDLSSPFVDALLPDGSRLHAVIPDITREHLSLNIRKFVVAANGLEDLVALGTITAHAARFLEAAVTAGLNIIVAGGTQAGKTTLLNTLINSIPARERVDHLRGGLRAPPRTCPTWSPCRPGNPTWRATARSGCAAW